jgi:hypothetical protein
MKKYQYRSSIEELYELSNSGKKFKTMSTLSDITEWAAEFGDNAIQGKVVGENFLDFLLIDLGSAFNIYEVIPATEDQDIKENFDAIIKAIDANSSEKITIRVNYKWFKDSLAKIKSEHINGMKNIVNRGDCKPTEVGIITNVYESGLPKEVKSFPWLKITAEQYEPMINGTLFKRFVKWVNDGKIQWENRRKKSLKTVKTKIPYPHQIEQRADADKQFLTSMAFPGAGKTDDQAYMMSYDFKNKDIKNAVAIFPTLALGDQNSREHLLTLKKEFGDSLKIINFSSQKTWQIETSYGFPVINLQIGNQDDFEKYCKMCQDPLVLTYTIGTYAGMSGYIKRFTDAELLHNWYFDESASLIPGQQAHRLEGLEDESRLFKGFKDLVEYQHQTGGGMKYWDAVNLSSYDPNAVAFGNEYYFGPYAGKGPYTIQYGVDNHIIADIEILLLAYDNTEIKTELGNSYAEDDPNMIDAYCLARFNSEVGKIYGTAKTIAYMNSAANCDPTANILKKYRPAGFYGSIVGGTKTADRQKILKAFANPRIDEASILNYIILSLGISENSANGVFMSRNMNDRYLTHSINRSTRRHPNDPPLVPLVNKPVGYVGFGIDKNDHSSLLESELFKQQIYKMLCMGISPKITVIDGQSKHKDDTGINKGQFLSKNVVTLSGDEVLQKKIEELIEVQQLGLERKGFKSFVTALDNTDDEDESLEILRKALQNG